MLPINQISSEHLDVLLSAERSFFRSLSPDDLQYIQDLITEVNVTDQTKAEKRAYKLKAQRIFTLLYSTQPKPSPGPNEHADAIYQKLQALRTSTELTPENSWVLFAKRNKVDIDPTVDLETQCRAYETYDRDKEKKRNDEYWAITLKRNFLGIDSSTPLYFPQLIGKPGVIVHQVADIEDHPPTSHPIIWKRLEILRINVEIKEIPHLIGNLTNLKILVIKSGNRGFASTTFPESFRNLKQLTELSLSDYPLRALPDYIGEFTLLEKLRLFNMNLTKLPNTFSNLTRLTELTLSGNLLRALPYYIAEFKQLEELRIEDMGLEELPNSLQQLPRLRLLLLSDNPRMSLPNFIGNFPALKYLHVANIGLNKLPDALTRLTQLKVLDISNNPLQELPDFISKLSQLETLYHSFRERPKNLGSKVQSVNSAS